MKPIVPFACVIAVLALGVADDAAPQNLVTNGSFETGPYPSSYKTLSPGDTTITGWFVTRDDIDYIGFFWTASDGQRSIDLDGTPGFGGIAQAFATVPGDTYRVWFDLAGNPFGDPTIKMMRVQAAGQSADFTFDITGHSAANMGCETQQWSFVADDVVDTLEFYSLHTDTTPGADISGPAIDNVVVEGPDPTGADSGAPGAGLALGPNVPNPFNPSPTIGYSVPASGFVTIRIFNAQGALVTTLASEPKTAGEHAVTWNGRGTGGQRVSSGVYFVRLVFGGHSRVGKIVLLK